MCSSIPLILFGFKSKKAYFSFLCSRFLKMSKGPIRKVNEVKAKQRQELSLKDFSYTSYRL